MSMSGSSSIRRLKDCAVVLGLHSLSPARPTLAEVPLADLSFGSVGVVVDDIGPEVFEALLTWSGDERLPAEW
jgi:hypothetical protein